MQDFLIAAQPYALEIVGLALTTVIGLAANKARQKWGVEIEAKHRDALHTALMTGARLALAKHLTAAAAIELILGYVKTSVPDAIGTLRPPQSVLENLAKAKLEQASGDALTKALKDALK